VGGGRWARQLAQLVLDSEDKEYVKVRLLTTLATGTQAQEMMDGTREVYFTRGNRIHVEGKTDGWVPREMVEILPKGTALEQVTEPAGGDAPPAAAAAAPASEPEPQPDPEAEAEAEPEPEPEVEPEAEPQPDPEAEPEAEPEAVTAPEAEAEADPAVGEGLEVAEGQLVRGSTLVGTTTAGALGDDEGEEEEDDDGLRPAPAPPPAAAAAAAAAGAQEAVEPSSPVEEGEPPEAEGASG
jgi:hypothetical protein